MILVRVEPESVGPLGMDFAARREVWLSGFPEGPQRERARARYSERGMEHLVGCWFSPAMANTTGNIDALTYANEIIGVDHRDTPLRIIALHIDDDVAESYRVTKLDPESYGSIRSANKEGEYLVPNDMPQYAQQILTIKPGEILTEMRYRQALEMFEADPSPSRITRAFLNSIGHQL
jgi:hypothetical protein